MKARKFLFIALVCAATGALADGSFQSSAVRVAPTHPAMYSFADVYRLTVGGAMAGALLGETGSEAPIRVAQAQGLAAEARFSVAPVPPRDTWLLLLAGLALAGWVAHRRLVHTL